MRLLYRKGYNRHNFIDQIENNNLKNSEKVKDKLWQKYLGGKKCP